MEHSPLLALDEMQNSEHNGIGGLGVLAHFARRGQPDASRLRSGLGLAPHRGSHLRTVMLGDAVLAVTAHKDPQGVALTDKWATAFAGFIDNPEALEAIDAGRTARGDEVAAGIARTIERRGFVETVRSLRGTFAVVATNGASLLCARDHLGLASLFHRDEARSIWVASEAKQVIAVAGIARQPNMEVIEGIFFGITPDDQPSALEGVDRVPRTIAMEFTRTGVRRNRFWDPEPLIETSDVALGDVAEHFHTLMDTAVRRVMRGRDALGLSGGIDSPAVAAYAAPAHLAIFGTPLGAVSNVYPNHPTVDERNYIEHVAERLGLPLHVSEPLAKPTDGLERWVQLLDGPFPVVSVAESAEHYTWVRSLGFRTLLTGEFAEFVTETNRHVLSHYLARGRIGPAIKRLQERRVQGVSRLQVIRQVARAIAPGSAIRAYRWALRRPTRVARPAWILGARYPNQFEDLPPAHRWIHEQQAFFRGAAVLLNAHDILQVHSGIRVRQPWADLDLWEFFLGLRAEVKHAFPSPKGLLRHLLRGRVPDLILDRRDKTVFDENLHAKIDRAALARWLVRPRHHVPWIDYGKLAQALEAPQLSIREYMWMKDLAAVQAFLDEW